MPEKLENLKVEDFSHPDDTAAMRSMLKSKAVDAFVGYIEEKNSKLVTRMATLGNCVRLTKENAPEVCRVLEDVCSILDYDTVPELYSTRSYKIDIVPSGEERPVFLVSDFVLNHYDRDLLYFDFGRAVTRLKSGKLRYYDAANMLISTTEPWVLVSDAVKMSLGGWMRKSELTADRGGLLACQNYPAAMSFLLNKAGMPIQEAKKTPITDYIEACKIENQLVKVGKNIQTLTNCTGWANDRILELFTWYASGQYDELLERYLD